MTNNTPQQSPQKARINTAPTISNAYDYYLYSDITEPEDYIDVVRMLRSCTERDTVTIYINCYGGRLHTATQILSAMHACKAPIKARVEGFAASAATLIALSADDVEIADHSVFMVHHYSGGAWGKGHEIVAQVAGTSAIYANLARAVYRGFMSDDEITAMIDGKDYWFGADEVRARLARRIGVCQKGNT